VKTLFLKDKLYKDEKAMTFYKDSVPDRASFGEFPLADIWASLVPRGVLVDHFCMVLKMHLVHEINVAPRGHAIGCPSG